MGTSKAINYKLEDFDIDHQEAYIYKKVKDRRNRALEHFLLSKGHQRDVFDSVRRMLDSLGFTQVNIPPNKGHPFPDKINGTGHDSYKSDLLNHTLDLKY